MKKLKLVTGDIVTLYNSPNSKGVITGFDFPNVILDFKGVTEVKHLMNIKTVNGVDVEDVKLEMPKVDYKYL